MINSNDLALCCTGTDSQKIHICGKHRKYKERNPTIIDM